MTPPARAFATLAILAFVLVSAACSKPAHDGPLPEPVETLMKGTPYQTPLYSLDSAKPGPTLLVLGGVHGDEPGGWLAAEALLRRSPPKSGKLLVIPRVNQQGITLGVRSTPEIGDLNRMYPGNPGGIPMAKMADQIAGVVRRYQVDVVLDLHESWSFYKDSPEDDVNLAALGQTISPNLNEPSKSLAKGVAKRANKKLPGKADFTYHEFPADYRDEIIIPPPAGMSVAMIPRNSGLYLAEMFPGTASILVEVGQQQKLDNRVKQQLVVVQALVDELPTSPAFASR